MLWVVFNPNGIVEYQKQLTIVKQLEEDIEKDKSPKKSPKESPKKESPRMKKRIKSMDDFTKYQWTWTL